MCKVSRILLVSLLASGAALAADANAGKAVFDRSCKSCHGADGTANPAVAKMMKVEIGDLKSAAVQSMTDADLKKIVTGGKGKMQPVKSLDAKQVDDVIAYVRTLKK
jgi:mono/diheme cytochrome c family protein